MSSTDFLRRMPGSEEAFAKRGSLLKKFHIDPILLIALACLTGVGLLVLYSASGESLTMVKRQATFIAVGYCVMLIIAQIDMDLFRRWAPWLYLVGVGLLVAVLLVGVGAKGAQRWLALPGLPRFQPSEVMKLALPMTIAWYFAGRALPPTFKNVFLVLVIIAIPTAMIGSQPDLGTSILIATSGIFVLYFAGLNWKYVVSAVALVLAALYPAWHFVLREYQKQRVLTLLNPESDKLGAGWNIIQSKTAIGSGGIDGKGWLQGTQSQLNFLPESHTDFIIAVLAEEHGLFGVLSLMGLYIVIIARCLVISSRAQQTFGRLLGGSITMTFAVYIFVNMSMVAGLLPVVGVPLPLVSQGGTSIVTLMAGFGCLMAIGTEEKRIVES